MNPDSLLHEVGAWFDCRVVGQKPSSPDTLITRPFLKPLWPLGCHAESLTRRQHVHTIGQPRLTCCGFSLSGSRTDYLSDAARWITTSLFLSIHTLVRPGQLVGGISVGCPKRWENQRTHRTSGCGFVHSPEAKCEILPNLSGLTQEDESTVEPRIALNTETCSCSRLAEESKISRALQAARRHQSRHCQMRSARK